MQNKFGVSLVIPCRNEEKGIGKIIKRALKIVDEVIVVDNNSIDRTSQEAKESGARVLKESRTDKRGIGYGYSLIKGMKAAKYETIITLDGDGTYPLNQIRSAVAHLRKNQLDMLLCTRFPLADSHSISWWRQLGVLILNLEAKILFNYPISDVLSGMWVIRKSSLNVLDLTEGGWNLSPEIKLSAIMHPDVQIGQFHINHYERRHGKSKQKLVATGFEHLLFIALYRLKHFGKSLKQLLSAVFLKPWRVTKFLFNQTQV